MRIKKLLAVSLSAAVFGPLTTIPAQAVDMPDPAVWGACPQDGAKDISKVIRTRHGGPYGPPENQLGAGDITLKCGTENVGFRHIVNRHGPQWQTLADIEGRNWRDIADMALTKNITNPDQTAPQDGGKWCVSSEIYLVNKDSGEVVKTKRTKTILTDKHEVLTTFPTDDGCN